MSVPRALWSLFTTIASIVIVVLVIQSCDRSATQASQGLRQAQHSLQRLAVQIQQAQQQATNPNGCAPPKYGGCSQMGKAFEKAYGSQLGSP